LQHAATTPKKTKGEVEARTGYERPRLRTWWILPTLRILAAVGLLLSVTYILLLLQVLHHQPNAWRKHHRFRESALVQRKGQGRKHCKNEGISYQGA